MAMRRLSLISLLLPTCSAFAPRAMPRSLTKGSLAPRLASPLDNIFESVSNEVQGALRAFGKKESSSSASPAPAPALPDLVVSPDYKLAAIFLAFGAVLDLVPYVQLTLGPLVTALGVLFFVQTGRIRFAFDSEAFSLINADGSDSGENVVVGGENRWTYDSFANWEFFPEGWIDQPQGPVLVYFKETQTPEDQWDVGPGQSANSAEKLAAGAVRGQVHFFPAICDTKQMRDEFQKRNCAKL
mmetsp:Transcript_18053/g.41304  ORF Transcript_18053/g.41304 Transcript_18053/m.41304 type:complete len:242 (-) Transcript_18053:158-883(-)